MFPEISLPVLSQQMTMLRMGTSPGESGDATLASRAGFGGVAYGEAYLSLKWDKPSAFPWLSIFAAKPFVVNCLRDICRGLLILNYDNLHARLKSCAVIAKKRLPFRR